MAYTFLDSADTIKKNYAQQLQDSIAAQNAVNAAGKLPFDYNISQAGKTYQPKVNQLYAGNESGRRALAERMANLGLGAAGGASQKEAADLSNNFLRGLTGVGLEKQNYIDEQSNAKTNLDAQNQARIADITAQNAAGLNQAMQQWRQYAEGQLLSMYLARRISRAEYNKQMNDIAAQFPAAQEE